VSFLEALATIPAALALGAAVLVFRWVTGGWTSWGWTPRGWSNLRNWEGV